MPPARPSPRHLVSSHALLLPSPQMIRSTSSKENVPTCQSTSRKPRAVPTWIDARPPSLGRRVVFSPTPLPSLQASPKHKRALHDNSCSGRPPKKTRRTGIYSNHPFLGLHQTDRGSSSPESEIGQDDLDSSPPTTPEDANEHVAVKSCDYFQLAVAFPDEPANKPRPRLRPRPVVPAASRQDELDEDETETETATDSETESDIVSALLLHRPVVPTILKPHALSSSSSPIRSPCNPFSRPRPSSAARPAPASWLKGILKPVVGEGARSNAVNEKEGTKRNGRGRKHIIGWDDMQWVEPCTDSARDGTESKSPGTDGKMGEATSNAQASRTRTGRGTTGHTGTGQALGEREGEDDDDDEARRRKRVPAGGNAGVQGSQAAQSATLAVSRDDPVLLRTPLLVLKASLRPVSADHVRPRQTSTAEFAPRLTPRSSPLAKEDQEVMHESDDEVQNLFETPTCLTDVEAAYVDLTRAIFQLPSDLQAPQSTLEPLKSFRKTLMRCLARDIDNIVSFPTWVKQQNSLPPRSPRSSSSVSSSPIRTSPLNSPPSKGKRSLTEEQMRRLRDELGVAQAALRCIAAITRDARVHSIFRATEWTSLLCLVATVPLTPSLNILVQRDLLPFVASVMHNQSLPREVLAPITPSHLVPALEAILRLPQRVDRHRIAFSEGLTAIAALLTSHAHEMVRNGVWRMWFRSSMLGLWDGPKKGMSVKSKSLIVAGSLIKCLTSPVDRDENGNEWIREREQIAKLVGEEMLALLSEVPEDSVIARRSDTTRLLLLTQQWSQLTKPKGDSTQTIDEANLLFHVSLLSILPALLGPSFRKLEEKGIGPWIKPVNLLSQHQTSTHLLTTIALSWTNLSFAFFRSISGVDDSASSWILRKKGNDNKALSVLSNIFTTRKDVWKRDGGTSSPNKKQRKQSHAKALSLAYAASIYGLTVVVHHGVSSVRQLASSTEVEPLSSQQLDKFDEVFNRLIVPILPYLTGSPFVETSNVGWRMFTSIIAARTLDDRFAVLEDIVNPALLDVQLASAKTSEYLDGVLVDIFARAKDCSRAPGWGREWVLSRLDKVLELFGECLFASDFHLMKDTALPVWNGLLDLIADEDSALLIADWLIELTLRNPMTNLNVGPKQTVWAATFAREESELADALQDRLSHLADDATAYRIMNIWEVSHTKPNYVILALARSLASLSDMSNVSFVRHLERSRSVLQLLRHYVQTKSLRQHSEVFESLAAQVLDVLSKFGRVGELLGAQVERSAPYDTETNLQLYTLFISVSHSRSEAVQMEILALGIKAVQSVLERDTVREDVVTYIGDMLAAASDQTYPQLYEAVLDSLAVFRPSSDSLSKYVPLLTPSLDRALDLHAAAVVDDATQLETFAPRPHLQHSLQPLLAFGKFWRATYDQLDFDVTYPPELISRVHLVRQLAQGVLDTESPTSQFHSQLDESIRMLSSIEKNGIFRSIPFSQHIPYSRLTLSLHEPIELATLEVSTRDYVADQSQFVARTDEQSFENDDTTLGTATNALPSASLRAESVVEETPKELQSSRSKASYASFASSTGAAASGESPPIEETLCDVKKNSRKRKRLAVSARETNVAQEEQDEESRISHGDVSRRKKVRGSPRACDRRSVEQEDPPLQSTNGTATVAKASVAAEGTGSIAASRTPSPTSSRASSRSSRRGRTSADGDRANGVRLRDEEAVRRVLALPLETVAHVGKLIGGTASLHRLMAIGEAAKDYFASLRRSPSRT
ncbi:uncharacterized protein JCM15063_005024 [Sporobolomyces koalae]|uniref:uncharacterized protein n=1 Tax=Sporobolomyces koalae TaxID=500713 RepID=UPI003172E46E